jgi:hypothetical protein
VHFPSHRPPLPSAGGRLLATVCPDTHAEATERRRNEGLTLLKLGPSAAGSADSPRRRPLSQPARTSRNPSLARSPSGRGRRYRILRPLSPSPRPSQLNCPPQPPRCRCGCSALRAAAPIRTSAHNQRAPSPRPFRHHCMKHPGSNQAWGRRSGRVAPVTGHGTCHC